MKTCKLWLEVERERKVFDKLTLDFPTLVFHLSSPNRGERGTRHMTCRRKPGYFSESFFKTDIMPPSKLMQIIKLHNTDILKLSLKLWAAVFVSSITNFKPNARSFVISKKASLTDFHPNKQILFYRSKHLAVIRRPRGAFSSRRVRALGAVTEGRGRGGGRRVEPGVTSHRSTWIGGSWDGRRGAEGGSWSYRPSRAAGRAARRAASSTSY